MSRSRRLFELLQLLRRRRGPTPGRALAEELGISLRTLYRDIATLQSQGAHIDGEAGVGYLLRPGFTLPPLMFSVDEIEAIGLGVKWVEKSADEELSRAASDVLAKIAAVVPDDLRQRLHVSPLLVGPGQTDSAEKRRLNALRKAIEGERKLAIVYRDLKGKKTARTVWPFGLAFFDSVRILVAWCEKRRAIRHFRIDRLLETAESGERYPRSKEALLAEWRLALEAETKT